MKILINISNIFKLITWGFAGGAVFNLFYNGGVSKFFMINISGFIISYFMVPFFVKLAKYRYPRDFDIHCRLIRLWDIYKDLPSLVYPIKMHINALFELKVKDISEIQIADLERQMEEDFKLFK